MASKGLPLGRRTFQRSAEGVFLGFSSTQDFAAASRGKNP
jgi:hypothetical protein